MDFLFRTNNFKLFIFLLIFLFFVEILFSQDGSSFEEINQNNEKLKINENSENSKNQEILENETNQLIEENSKKKYKTKYRYNKF